MSTEQNKALVRRSYEEFNKQNMAAVDELFAADYVAHGTGTLPDIDLAGLKQWWTAFRKVFPDAHYVAEDLIAGGDKVVARVTFRGTHQGEFTGMPATGKQVSWTGIGIDRIEADKFVEAWASADILGLMQQLGAIPQMAQAGG